jgi:hypothetical protein
MDPNGPNKLTRRRSRGVRLSPARSVVWSALWFALLGVVVVMVTRMLVVPWVESADGWVIPRDAFVPLNGARYVANGAMFQLYDGNAGTMGYPYPPGLPVLLAWVPWIGDHFHLTGDVTYTRRRPTIFWLLGPGIAFLGSFPLLVVAGRAALDAGRQRVVALQGWIFLVMGFAPLVFFHPEDTIAIACLMGACLRTRRADWRGVGALIGLALLFKQWALFPALPLLIAAPRGKRGLVAFYALALPAIVMVPFLLATPSTWDSLTGALATLQLGHRQLWLGAFYRDEVYGNADVLRALWGGAALVIALRIRRVATVDTLLAAIGVVLLLRVFFEPTIFGYYVVPPAVFAVVWSARNGHPIALRSIAAIMLAAFCLPHTFPEPIFWALLVIGLGYVCGPIVRAVWKPGEDVRSGVIAESWKPSPPISSEIGSV